MNLVLTDAQCFSQNISVSSNLIIRKMKNNKIKTFIEIFLVLPYGRILTILFTNRLSSIILFISVPFINNTVSSLIINLVFTIFLIIYLNRIYIQSIGSRIGIYGRLIQVTMLLRRAGNNRTMFSYKQLSLIILLNSVRLLINKYKNYEK